MAPIDPELRRRRIAALRAAYQANPTSGDDSIEPSTARHSRVLLGRILLALSGPPGPAVAPACRPDGKAFTEV
ncbi:MAG: hypothetical protein INR63_18550 [Actinomycetospora chiangmaiensis]|nr:hypothetical protein [Actinomycetospora chiangmaiensis]